MTDEIKKAEATSAQEAKPVSNKNNVIWIVLSIVFGVIGGGIAWLVLHKRSPSAALTCLLIGAGVTVITGAGFFITLLMVDRPDNPRYTFDQVLSAAQQMSPECNTVHT
ncbi:MAG TPA: hypothetical protein DCX22_04700 [Dehalococcoidia bacterium]|nr:hypothetical protein [Dehalococcoidia bacterium]